MAKQSALYHGLLLIDKPTGCTSHDVVDRVRRVLRQKRVGHCGTLDPAATGLLLLTTGKATRLSRFLTGAPKAYRSSARAVRYFCPECGSQLTFLRDDDPHHVSVNTPTLDDPAAVPPRRHIWRESRIPWFEAADDLPRHDRAGPGPGT